MNNTKVDKIYSLRQNFSIIGLTGRTGAGVSKVAEVLSGEFSSIKDIQPLKKGKLNNKHRRYNISYNYAKNNWKKYKLIKYRDIILLHLVREDLSNMNQFFVNNKQFECFQDIITHVIKNNQNIIDKIKKISHLDHNLKDKNELKRLGKLFFSSSFIILSKDFNYQLKDINITKRIKLFQQFANNIRKAGSCYNNQDEIETSIYSIAETINRIIKGYKINNEETHIVIDSLRNSLEIMFFKERYAAFYMIAVNSPNRRHFLKERYNHNNNLVDNILKIDKEEYEGKGISIGNFFVQDVQNCIQKSDIYFNHNPAFGTKENDYTNNFKELKKDSYYYLVGQIIKYTSLILHPGLITPSAQERSMQIAYVAKNNSGCISRKVGAVITDKDFSVKSIGWNDAPKNTTPCLLKNINNLKNNKDSCAYSPYERDEKKYIFNEKFKDYYNNINSETKNGLNLSYCFKDMQNYIDHNENQVHTRSLHAEENAMLQISKYGGQPVNDGILFTTASPCELCSKKARQLEIKEIYYIDPYPGISNWHILRDGEKIPKFILYTGAVGKAYHKLYEPFMSYKDELALLTGKRPKVDYKKEKKDKLRKELEDEIKKEIIINLANGKNINL